MPTPCSVTGTLQTLTSGRIAQGKVIFQLTNIGTGNPIGVSGTSVIPALTYTVMTAQDGTFSVSLWGNDNITPANTLYAVTFRDYQGNEIGPILYSIVGASANLNTLIAAGTILPPVIVGQAIISNPASPQTITGQSLTLTNSAPLQVDTISSVGKLDNILFVDGVKFATLDAAIAAAGSVNPTLIIIPSNYAGTFPPISAITANLVIWDFHAPGPSPLPLGANTNTWNGQTPGVFSFLRHSLVTNNPLNKSYELTTNLADYSGSLPASTQSLEGITSVARLVGAVTIPNANTSLVGLESHGLVLSTGGTLGFLYGYVVGNQILGGSTTNVTNSYGLRVQSLVNSGGGTVTNNYGLLLDVQTGGSARNFSFYSAGAGLFASDTSSSGINFEDSALVARPVMTALSATNEIRFRPLLDTAGYHWMDRASATDWMFIQSTGVSIPSIGLTVGGKPASVTIASGTSTLTANAALGAVTSQAAITTAATGTLTTDSIEWSYASAPGAGDSLCTISPYVTAGNVNFVRSNPTAAAQNVSAIIINWRVVR